jgi:serine/threonine protein kinase
MVGGAERSLSCGGHAAHHGSRKRLRGHPCCHKPFDDDEEKKWVFAHYAWLAGFFARAMAHAWCLLACAGGTYGDVELRGRLATKLSRLANSGTGFLCGGNLSEVAILGFAGGMEGIVRVHGVSVSAAGLQLVMDRGCCMDEWLAKLGSSGVRQRSENAEAIFRGLLAAVVGLHRLGIAHLDIKPGNVLLWFQGDRVVRVALIDFGASRFVGSWCPAGSPVYVLCTYEFAAPEAFRGARPSFACDAFSVGAVMFEVVHGRPFANFRGMGKGEIVAWWKQRLGAAGQQGGWEAPPDAAAAGAGFSEGLWRAVRGLLVEDPEQRLSLERVYAEFVPEGRLLEGPLPPRVVDAPRCADESARSRGVAFLARVCRSAVVLPLAVSIYARYRGGVWPQRASAGEARVLRACADLAQVVRFPDSAVTDEHAGEVGALVGAFGVGGCLSDTVERVLARVFHVHVPDTVLLWEAVAGAQGTWEQAGLYIRLAR